MTGTILSDLEIFAHFFIVGLEVEKGLQMGTTDLFEMMGMTRL